MIDALPAQELMDRDAANLRATASDGKYRVEIYRFASPSVTAGRNARVTADDLARWSELGHDFARRPTGGGILRHERDISFGFAFPVAEGETDPSAAAFLRRVSSAISESLREQGIETGTAESGGGAPSHCFQRAVGCELMYRGKKVLGLAARRVRGAVLVQGSLAVERNAERDREAIGVGPEIDLAGTGFDAERFALAMRSMTTRV